LKGLENAAKPFTTSLQFVYHYKGEQRARFEIHKRLMMQREDQLLQFVRHYNYLVIVCGDLTYSIGKVFY
jgi:hypothetical protein